MALSDESELTSPLMTLSDESELTSPLMALSDESELTSPITQVLGDDLSADRRVELADVLLEMSVPLGVENATKTFIAAREGLDGSLLEKLLYDPSSNVRLIVFRKLPVMISALMPGTEVPPAMKTGVNERPTPRPSRRPIGGLLLSAHHGAHLRPSRSHVPPVHTHPSRSQCASSSIGSSRTPTGEYATRRSLCCPSSPSSSRRPKSLQRPSPRCNGAPCWATPSRWCAARWSRSRSRSPRCPASFTPVGP